MAKCKVTIINKLGLHARAAAKFVSIANQYPCQVRVGRSAEGEQATEALQALQDLIARRFDEEA